MNTQAVILAAGYSSRAGSNKLLFDVCGKTIIENCIDTFNDICSTVIVVGGHAIDEIKPVLKNLKNVNLIFNPNYDKGMFSSVKEGLRYVNDERVFITPGDLPLIKKETIYKMLLIRSDIIIPSYKGSKGHPVLLSRKHIYDIINNDYFSLRAFLSLQTKTIINSDDIGVIFDIDTMQDYMKLQNLVNEI